MGDEKATKYDSLTNDGAKMWFRVFLGLLANKRLRKILQLKQLLMCMNILKKSKVTKPEP